MTYSGAIDLDAIEDANERIATEMQISEFGQIPRQLWKEAPHPARFTKDEIDAYEQKQAKLDIDDSAKTAEPSRSEEDMDRKYSVGRLLEKSHMASYRDLRS